MLSVLIACIAFAQPTADGSSRLRSIEIPLNADREVSVAEVIRRLAEAGSLSVEAPKSSLTLPTSGLAGRLARTLLEESLGTDFDIRVIRDRLILSFPESILSPANREALKARLADVAARAEKAAKSREEYGMTALASYRPNDPARPTICLVHGLNSSSGGFVHMVRPLEQAGYGIVVYDYPFNRPLEESCERFRRDWRAFRLEHGETRPWALLGHSMGCLLARSLIEGPDRKEAGEVSSLILIAPVNQGAHVARLQNVLQLVNGVIAINDRERERGFSALADGVGKAAEDILPGSRFLTELNKNPRCKTVPYHILAGDVGFLTREARKRVEAKIDETIPSSGFVGKLARIALKDLPETLDEISDGTGDGCVALARTKLDGVDDHQTIHANHAELIRAPVLFADPGPVACMPYVIKWLAKDLPAHKAR